MILELISYVVMTGIAFGYMYVIYNKPEYDELEKKVKKNIGCQN